MGFQSSNKPIPENFSLPNCYRQISKKNKWVSGKKNRNNGRISIKV